MFLSIFEHHHVIDLGNGSAAMAVPSFYVKTLELCRVPEMRRNKNVFAFLNSGDQNLYGTMVHVDHLSKLVVAKSLQYEN